MSINGLSTPVLNYAEETRIRGTAVHKASESLAQGYTPTIDDPTHEPFIAGLAAWYRKTQPEVVALERRIVSLEKRCTGQIDIGAIITDDRRRRAPFIVDVKTGSEAPFHEIQIAGYKDLALDDEELWQLFGAPYSTWTYLQRESGLRRAILYLPGDGKYQFRESIDPMATYRFSSALGLLQWRYDNGLLHYVDNPHPETEEPEPAPPTETVF